MYSDKASNPMAAEMAQEAQTDLSLGLTASEAERRFGAYGPNEVAERRPNPYLMFARKFWGLSAWMLELIVVLSWVLGKRQDAVVVSMLLVMNAVLSFWQERQASAAVDALKKRLQVNARVLRGGMWTSVPARELVPGDVTRVRAGDFVPADLRLVEGHIFVDQSALTGESQEIERRTQDTLYSGSVVRHGECTALVVTTGPKTYYGRTTELVQMAAPKLHIEEVISRVVQWLFVVVGIMAAVMVAGTLMTGKPWLDVLPLTLVVLMSAVPVALPVMFTVTMALGATELARKNVLVSRLSATEDAATMDVICVDKTGTITQNCLAIVTASPMPGFTSADVLLAGALASQEANHDPIDLAFLAAAKEQGLASQRYVQESFSPFDPQTRRTEARVRGHGEHCRVVKGAVASVAMLCGLDGTAVADLEAHARSAASADCRALAVAKGDEECTPHLVGIVMLRDPPRPDSASLIAQLRALGVQVKMLTGDALPVAQEIARSVGLGDKLVRASELERLFKEDPDRAARLAEESDGFAEIYPEGKYNVVSSLQKAGHVVGMTGDGLNDAPALRQAEVGIAVNNATDVAKGAASVVLTSEGLSGIVDLVINGRRIYQRIATWIVNKISRTILKSGFVVLSFLLTGQYIISAFAMLLMVFLNDFTKISIATDNVRWSSKPEKWNVLALVKVAAVLGVLSVAEALGLVFVAGRMLGDSISQPVMHTVSFEILFLFAVFSILVVRERRRFWRSCPSRGMLLSQLFDLAIVLFVSTWGFLDLPGVPLQVTLSLLVSVGAVSLLLNDWVKVQLINHSSIRW